MDIFPNNCKWCFCLQQTHCPVLSSENSTCQNQHEAFITQHQGMELFKVETLIHTLTPSSNVKVLGADSTRKFHFSSAQQCLLVFYFDIKHDVYVTGVHNTDMCFIDLMVRKLLTALLWLDEIFQTKWHLCSLELQKHMHELYAYMAFTNKEILIVPIQVDLPKPEAAVKFACVAFILHWMAWILQVQSSDISK